MTRTVPQGQTAAPRKIQIEQGRRWRATEEPTPARRVDHGGAQKEARTPRRRWDHVEQWKSGACDQNPKQKQARVSGGLGSSRVSRLEQETTFPLIEQKVPEHSKATSNVTHAKKQDTEVLVPGLAKSRRRCRHRRNGHEATALQLPVSSQCDSPIPYLPPW